MWQASPHSLFWAVWKARNGIVVKDEAFSLQRMETSFVFLLWSKTKLSIGDGPSTIAGFIDWLGCKLWGFVLYILDFLCSLGD